jgi:hypothetical protein
MVQGIFWNFRRHFQQVQFHSPMCEMATGARNFASGEGIAATTHGMSLVRMSHAVVERERDRRHIAG